MDSQLRELNGARRSFKSWRCASMLHADVQYGVLMNLSICGSAGTIDCACSSADTCKMERRNGQNQVSFDLLPSICEYTEFGSEEDYQRTEPSSELIKTRNAYSASTLRFEDEEEPEEEQPLLSLYTRDSKVCDEEWKLRPKLAKGRKVQIKRRNYKVRCGQWKPKLAKGWKMQKKRVKIVWAKSRRCRQSLRSSMKVLAECPLLLLKTMRDAYVSVMTRMASKCNVRMWYLAGARLL